MTHPSPGEPPTPVAAERAAFVERARRPLQALLLLSIAAALHVVARSNYLLFHGLVELFGVVVALSLFVVAWTARRYLESGYLLLVGTAYLFVGLLDVVHTLAYPGMTVFAERAYQSSQLWIAGRFMLALSFLGGFAFLSSRRQPNRYLLLAAYGAVTAHFLACIFQWKRFPPCYVEGVGQTPFKVGAEIAITALLGVALALLAANRRRFEPRVARAIAASLALSMAAEIAFALYDSPVGLANQVGHFLKLFSYVAIYVALVESSLENPYAIVFRELNAANVRLSKEVEARRMTELAKDAAIDELRAAVKEIQALRGIIPICSHCKKIREDHGAWSQLEAYIQRRSAAQFSHGICPDCARRYFPDLEPDATPPPRSPL